MTGVKYPEICVQLVDLDGNAFAVLGRCLQAMRRAHIPQEERDKFYKEATSGDYNHLLATCMEWFNIE